MPTAKKRNPQDSTLRNVRAAKASIALLATALRDLQKRVAKLEKRKR